jgi:hypothetical protein
VTPELNEDFHDMVVALLRASVDFIVIGAHALAAHGLPRATGDFDILVRPSPDNAARVIAALDDFGAPTRAHGVTATDFEREGAVYQIGLPPRRIDLLTSITGVSFDEAWSSRVPARVAGLEFTVIGREALLKNKRATGRDKDLVDVRALESHAERQRQK